MTKDKVLIVIPAHNEAENIGNVLQELKKHFSSADVIVIDDDSSDQTPSIIAKNHTKYFTTIFNLGYAWAIQTGIKYARDHNYDYVIQMDADGQHLPSEAVKLLDKMKATDADIVIGSRYFKHSEYKSPFFRKIGTRFFSILVRILTRQKISDPLSGFQCLNRKVIEYYANCGNYPEYPDANLIIEMLLKGYKIEETPIKMRARKNGTSMHSGLFKPVKYMITQFYTCIVLFVKFIGKRSTNHE